MRKAFAACTCAALLAAGLAAVGPAGASAPGTSASPSTLAIDGDVPYGTSNSDHAQFNAMDDYIASINNDPNVGLLMHVGDIHSGKQNCTEAYDDSIFQKWTEVQDPLVYTPGDNEWTDCHKSGEGGGKGVDYADGNPVANLDLIRSIFFQNPGTTLGQNPIHVTSQALTAQRTNTTDKNYVENVMWEQSNTLFVTVNIPGGSNNDADPWFGAASASPEQQAEMRERTAADLHWLNDAFARAARDHVGSVVIGTQADMWDLDGKDPSHIANYLPFIEKIAEKTTDFAKPVLLFNGDSHVYRSDNPLVDNAPCATESAECEDDAYDNQAANGYSPNVPNFHRVVVHGSTAPMEWLKLVDDPNASNATTSTSFGPFSWSRQITSLGFPTP